jgi:hypothetical protein
VLEKTMHFRFSLLLLLCLLLSSVIPRPTGAELRGYTSYLPLVTYRSLTPNRLGIDLRQEAPDSSLAWLHDSGARWSRAGDVDWSRVEAQPGILHWEEAAGFEANVRRIRVAGLEPTGILQRTPLWAAALPGRVCGPPTQDALANLAQFAEQMARRYATGPLAVHVWQFGNEIDFPADQITDQLGSGCWGTPTAPFYGGDYYGLALKQVAAAIRRGNPGAEIIAGGLVHFLPDDTRTLGFVRGMITTGGADSFDGIGYTGYLVSGVNDRMLLKAARLRGVLAEYGLGWKRLLAAEIGYPCFDPVSCSQGFDERQSDYAARIYPEAIAADIDMIMWYSLQTPDNDALRHGLLEAPGSTPRPAYYALKHSQELLHDARPNGGPPELPPENAGGVQTITLQTSRGLFYVVWDPRRAGSTAFLPIPAGSQVTCTDRLDLPTPITSNCTGLVANGFLVVQVVSPRYIEVVR